MRSLSFSNSQRKEEFQERENEEEILLENLREEAASVVIELEAILSGDERSNVHNSIVQHVKDENGLKAKLLQEEDEEEQKELKEKITKNRRQVAFVVEDVFSDLEGVIRRIKREKQFSADVEDKIQFRIADFFKNNIFFAFRSLLENFQNEDIDRKEVVQIGIKEVIQQLEKLKYLIQNYLVKKTGGFMFAADDVIRSSTDIELNMFRDGDKGYLLKRLAQLQKHEDVFVNWIESLFEEYPDIFYEGGVSPLEHKLNFEKAWVPLREVKLGEDISFNDKSEKFHRLDDLIKIFQQEFIGCLGQMFRDVFQVVFGDQYTEYDINEPNIIDEDSEEYQGYIQSIKEHGGVVQGHPELEPDKEGLIRMISDNFHDLFEHSAFPTSFQSAVRKQIRSVLFQFFCKVGNEPFVKDKRGRGLFIRVVPNVRSQKGILL